MGKKTRKEREKKRESFAATRGRQKQKNRLITIGIFAGVAVIVGFSAYNFATNQTNVPGAPPGAGFLGSAHENISLLVRIFDDKFDFSSPSYQVKSSWIHFEGSNGNIIHRHATGVTMGYLFETLGLELTDECYIFQDGREFCSNEDYSLKFYINNQQVDSILNYIAQDNDKILVSYGNDTPEKIEGQLLDLDVQR